MCSWRPTPRGLWVVVSFGILLYSSYIFQQDTSRFTRPDCIRYAEEGYGVSYLYRDRHVTIK